MNYVEHLFPTTSDLLTNKVLKSSFLYQEWFTH